MIRTFLKDKTLLKVTLFIVTILSFSLVFILSFYVSLKTPNSEDSQEVEINIERGATAKKVAVILYDKKLIKSKTRFLLTIKLKGKSNAIRAGKYKIKKNLSILEVIDLIIGKNSINITIPEGLTLEQIANLLEQQGIILSKEDFINSANTIENPLGVFTNRTTPEGYLFPDTYNFIANTDYSEILMMMFNRFRKKVYPLQIDYEKMKLSLDDIVIIASLVEKEAKVNEERPIIATVLLNRLKRKMKLNCDATVRYALKKYDASLTKDDLLVDSPYNTYLHYGLPPSPICNPGLKSIIAVLNPSDVDYLYYCYKGDGTHYFSKTLKEHNQAVKNFLRKQNK